MNELCTFLEWDTSFFGRRIGRVNSRTVDAEQMQVVEDWCVAQRIECLYLQIDAAHMPSLRLAEAHAFQLMEVRLFMEKRLDPGIPVEVNPPAGVVIRPTIPEDVPALQNIAAGSYIYTRYHADPRFAPAWGDYYRIWVQNSLTGLGNFHLTAEHDGQVVGFISGQANDAATPPEQIFELIAVDPTLRLSGVGRALLESGMEWARQHQRLRITFATQGSNIPLQRAVQRLGFLTTDCTLFYHRWFQ